jgi:hypothetical protein
MENARLTIMENLFMSEINYRTIERQYLEDVNEYAEGQYKYIAKKIIGEILCTAKNNKVDPALFDESNLDRALDLLSDLKYAIDRYPENMWDENKKISRLYIDYNWDGGVEPWVSHRYEININSLNEVISKYLSYEWFSSPTFEWFVINAYLTYYVECNRKEYIHSSPFSARALAATFSTKLSYYLATFLIFKILGILSWILSISFILWAFIKGWFVIGVVLTAWIVISLFSSIILFFMRYKSRKNHRKLFLDLIYLKTYVSACSWSPSFVMKKAKALNKKLFLQGLIPLISKMIKRDSEIFNYSK